MPSSGDDESLEESNSRSNTHGEPPRKRAKRSRYISIACNECKRRKIKCNGESPCKRCGHLGLACIYAASSGHNFKETQEYKQMTTQINTLQQAVESLSASNVNNNTSQYNSRHVADPSSSTFEPPTQDAVLDDRLVTSMAFTPQTRTTHSSKDPIWLVRKEEAIRLIHVWESNIHPTLPVVNIERTLQHVEMLHNFLGGARRAGLMISDLPGADAINDQDTLRLKLILATAMAVEGATDGDLSCRMFASVVSVSESLLFKPADLDGLEILLLCAVCAFHKSDESLSWRLVGVTVRMVFESGLNNHTGFNTIMSRPANRFRATVIMWSIYLLDRHWSMLQCFPAAIREDDIDHFRPGHDYLFNALELTELTGQLFSKFTRRRYRHVLQHLEEVRQMDHELVEWYSKLGDNVRFDYRNATEDDDGSSVVSNSMLILLKWNQYRITTAHPVFLITMTFKDNYDIVDTAMNLARETILTICHVSTWPTFRTNYLLSAQFILPCITLLLLAAVHAPERYQASFQEDFHNAVDLLRHEKAHSYMGKKVLHVLKLLSQIGQLVKQSLDEPDPATMLALRKSQMPFSPPELMSPQPIHPLVLGIVEENDSIDQLIDDVKNLYDAQTEARLHDFSRQEALTRVFRDLT